MFDFNELPDREDLEYLVHVSCQGRPYDYMVFQNFDTLVEYFRSHEKYGLTYDVVTRVS